MRHEIVSYARSHKGPFGISVNICVDESFRDFRELVAEFARNKEEIRRWIDTKLENLVTLHRESLSVEEWIPGWSELIQVCFTHIPEKPVDTPIANLGGVYRIGSKGNEWLKISDAIGEKIGQLIPGIPNVLVICNDSDSFNFIDCRVACRRYCEAILTSDPKVVAKLGRWGFATEAEALHASRRLSAVVFRGNGRPPVSTQTTRQWNCDYENWVTCFAGHDHPISDDLLKQLISMN